MVKNIIILILLIISIYYYKHSEYLELTNKSLEIRNQQLENKDDFKVDYIPMKNGEVLN